MIARLYKIQHGDTEPVFFKDKRTAKIHREALEYDGVPGNIIIMRGPDHWRGESFNITTNTPRTQKHRWG